MDALRQAVKMNAKMSDHAVLVDALQLYEKAIALRSMRNAWAESYLLPSTEWLRWLCDEECEVMKTDADAGSASDMKNLSTTTRTKVNTEIKKLNALASSPI